MSIQIITVRPNANILGIVDIDTSLHMYIIPICDYFTEEVIGAYEMICAVDILALVHNDMAKITDKEMELFNMMNGPLSEAIKNKMIVT